jgi:hypothetical protein
MAKIQSALNKYWNIIFFGWQNLLECAKESFEPLAVRILLVLNLIINIFLWIMAYQLNKIANQELVILHYNVDFGVKLIGSIKMLYVFPAISLVILFSNLTLLLSIKRPDRFLAYLLLGVSITSSNFLFIGLGMIYLINF